MSREIVQIPQISNRQKVIHERKSGRHPFDQRLVALTTEVGIEPDQSMAAVLEDTYLFSQCERVPALTTIADDHDHAASMKDLTTPASVEGGQALTDASSP